MFERLLESAWLGPLLWAASYVSDFLLTLSCARMYRAQDMIVFEGSYEITPLFQADVDALRQISPRFLVALIASTAYLGFVRSIAGPRTGMLDLYVGVLALSKAA